MKNLNFIFDLLFFPFLFLIRFDSSQNSIIYFNRERRDQGIENEKKIKSFILNFILLFSMSSGILFAGSGPENTPDISLSPATQSVTEGNGDITLTFTITLDIAPNKNPIAVNYTTVDDTAISGTNYISVSGTKNFPQDSGPLSQTFTVTIHSDIAISSNKTFTVVISTVEDNQHNSSNITNGTSTITIIPAPTTPPTISGIPNQTVTVNTVFTPLNLSIYTTEADGDTVTYTTTALPSGLTLSAGVISGTPDTVGLTTVTATATDTDGLDTDTFDINVIAAPSTSADLNISKAALDSDGNIITTFLAVDTSFIYTIDVTNNGPDEAVNIVVTDTLPSGVDIDIASSNTDSPDWNCSESSGTVTCNYDGNLSNGSTQVITLNVTTPSIEGNITNNVSVSSTNDTDTSNNTAFVEVTVGNTSNPADLCYTNSVGDDKNQCDLAGILYYAGGNRNECVASVDIRNLNTTDTLSSIVVYKLYEPGATNGSCTGSCTGPTTFTKSGYESYPSGYSYNLGSIASETNTTIIDVDTYNSSTDINGSILYAEYIKNGLAYSGKLLSCPGSLNLIDFTANIDFVDTIVATGPSPEYEGAIQTKISNKPNYSMTGVYLGTGDDPIDSTSVFTGDIDMTVILYLSDDTCTETERLYTVPGGTNLVVADFTQNDSTVGTTNFTMAYTSDILAKRKARIKYKALDFSGLIDASGINCPNSSTSGSASGTVTGIPACVTSTSGNSTPAERYKSIFGNEAFTRCWEAIVNGQPCLSNANNAVVPEPYNTIYGCLECSLGEIPYTCSDDAFAIRPDHFDIDTTDTDFPNLLRAGEDYNMTVFGHDYGVTASTLTSGSNDYNQSGGSGGNLDLNQTRLYANGTIENVSNQLFGNLVWSAWDFNITNGISNQNGILTTLADTEVAGVQYDDVGKIVLSVEDREWASVDINNPNDSTPHDCSDDGAYICGDRNVTYIPDHFSFEELNITNHAGPDNTFTYVAKGRGMPTVSTMPVRSPMAARIQTHIRALTKNGNITKNFRTDKTSAPYAPTLYYENDINVTMVVTVPSSGTNMYIYPEADESNITNSYIGFGRTGTVDLNGTRNVYWNESDFPLEFNFNREINEEANPFDVNGTYLKSIIINSHYIDPDDGDTADINGSRISEDGSCGTDPNCVMNNAENNATFYYGRTRASKYFYEDITASSVLTPILANVYCDPSIVNCTDYGVNTVIGTTDELNWYLSLDHNATRGDGNVTLKIGTPLLEGSGSPTINGSTNPTPENIMIITNAINNDVNISSGASPTLPMTVPIELVQDGDPSTPPFTNAWLIYNQFDPILLPSPFYKVRFIDEATWTGEGQTGHVIDVNASYKKSQRVDW